MSALSIPETVDFQQAIALTQQLLEQLENHNISDRQVQDAVSKLVASKPGARGFFATYLTDDRPIANSPAPAILNAFQPHSDRVAELLVKNLAMSSAMAVEHRRRGNDEMAASSEQVRSRTVNLISRANLPQLSRHLDDLHQSVTTGAGEYRAFLDRWGYDREQQDAIRDAAVQARTTIESGA